MKSALLIFSALLLAPLTALHAGDKPLLEKTSVFTSGLNGI